VTTDRGVFVGVAVQSYEHNPDLLWPAYDAAVMDGLSSELGFSRRFVIGDRHSPTVEELKGWLTETLGGHVGPDDVLLLYWSGHGIAEKEVHYLLASDSPAEGFSGGRAIPASWLAKLLPHVARALVVIDVCNAGAGAMDLAAAINAGVRSKKAATAGESGIVIMAASRPTEPARDGTLASAFEDAVLHDERCGRFNDKYVRLGDLFNVLNESLGEGRPVSSNVVDWDAPLNLLLNPRWGRGLVFNDSDGTLFDLQARGVNSSAEAGSYFSDRQRVMSRIAEWLDRSRPGGGMLVVTGPPGSGKSAVIARVVTLSRTGEADAETSIPSGSVWAAIQARGKTLGTVVDGLAGLLGIELPSRSDQSTDVSMIRRQTLLDEMRAMARKESVTIAVDALDEAATDQDAAIAELLAEIAAQDRLRVLVGTRPGRRGSDDERSEGLLGALGAKQDDIVNLADPVWESERALAGYIERRLASVWNGSSPDASEQAKKVADVMAEKLKGQFHVARVAVFGVADRGPPADPSTVRFPRQIDEAIAEDLRRRFELGSPVQSLLRALAWAEGDGFPEHIWLAVARVIPSTRGCGDDAVEQAISKAGDYLVSASTADNGNAGPCWRLYHSTYVEYFQRTTLENTEAEEKDLEALIVDALTPPNWGDAHAYAASNLATHAAKAGTLGILVRDPEYLVHAEPSVLLASLSSIPPDDEGLPAARRYKRAAHHLIGATLGQRAAYLQLAAARHGDPSARSVRRADQPWSWRWLRMTRSRGPDRVLPIPNSGQTVSLHQLEGRTVAVTGGEHVCVVDLVTGRTLFAAERGGNPYTKGSAALVERQDGPNVLSLVEVPQNPLDESGRPDTTSIEVRRWLRSWSLKTGEEAAMLAGNAGDFVRGSARPFAVGSNRMLVVALTEGSVWEQDCLDETWWIPASLNDLMVCCVSVLSLKGDDYVALAGTDDGEVVAWSVASHAQGRAKAHDTAVTAIAGARTSRGAVVVSGDRNRFSVWRLAENHSLEGPICSHDQGVESLACTELDGHLFVATVADGRACLWRVDLDGNSLEMVTRLEAGADDINDVDFGVSEQAGSLLVAAAGSAGSPNVWNVSGWGSVRPASGAMYVWGLSDLVHDLTSESVGLPRALGLVAPARAGESAALERVVALWEGNTLTQMDGSDGIMRPGFPRTVAGDGTKACAIDSLRLDSGETVFVLGFESGFVLGWSSLDDEWVGTETGGRAIRSMAVVESPGGPKQMLALDMASDLHYFAWEQKLNEGIYRPPEEANSLYPLARDLARVRLLGDEEMAIEEIFPGARVVYGVSGSQLGGSPAFVISGNAGCVFACDPSRGKGLVDVGFDFPVFDAVLSGGYLAVRADWEVLLFRVGDDPSRAAGSGLEPKVEGPIAVLKRGESPVWRGSWGAPVNAISLRQGAKGLRLVTGCLDGVVHVHDVGTGGVAHIFSLDCDSPVAGVLSLSDGGTVVATWSGILCVE
jgi:Caspase domain